MSSSYSSEFKQEAAKLDVESDQSVAQTARDLGVNPNTLYTWITKHQQPDSPTALKGQRAHSANEYEAPLVFEAMQVAA